jgi:hypothetical protein
MYEERALVAECGDEFKHDAHPDDLILNLSHLRNAWVLQQYQPPHPFQEISIEMAASIGVQ